MLELLAGPAAVIVVKVMEKLRDRLSKSQLDRIEAAVLRVDNTLIETTRSANTTAQGLLELREEVHRETAAVNEKLQAQDQSHQDELWLVKEKLREHDRTGHNWNQAGPQLGT